jgi:hypothetical protein
VSSLTDELERLTTWLRRNGDAPTWSASRIVESSRIQYGPTDRIPSAALFTVEAYEPRFEQLLSAGYGWINLSALGVMDDALLVCVELPRDATGVPRGRTQVVLSGPPIDVRTRALVWDASTRMQLVD